MSVVYELLDNSGDIITIETIDNSVYIDFPISVEPTGLSIDKARQLIEYLKQAVADVEGGE